jgi:cytochrome oxidase Cu insertion factor (SCO1/SenC/PrrC family)
MNVGIMRAMRAVLLWAFWILSSTAAVVQAAPAFPESEFRRALGVADTVHVSYRGPDCAALDYDGFAAVMVQPGIVSDVDRAGDGVAVTVTARRRGSSPCPAAYPPATEMPAFDLRDLAGKRVTAASLKGKPTVVSFYFSQCKPCILEVGPLNRFAASRSDLNFLAMTFDERNEAREFVARYKLRWRVVPDARDVIDRVRVKQYPMLALFDAQGRLLGTRLGGVRDELEAATLVPQISRWVDGLLRTQK